jgi:hypothetical protein
LLPLPVNRQQLLLLWLLLCSRCWCASDRCRGCVHGCSQLLNPAAASFSLLLLLLLLVRRWFTAACRWPQAIHQTLPGVITAAVAATAILVNIAAWEVCIWRALKP